jgi:hypothetical protein
MYIYVCILRSGLGLLLLVIVMMIAIEEEMRQFASGGLRASS